ncbi:B12-binding domain-containing radical SAM protein [Candidatus Woesearchaeota archaeon]|nr:B12-binding domain-containing radical SAM protein [Candidatus Woesearchaeota archaeon]
MRIVLINPRVLDTPNHPLGILYVAACLEKENFDIEVIDSNFDESAVNIAKKALSLKPEIIGLGSTTPQFIHALNIASEIKKTSNIPIILGGVHPTILPQEVLRNNCVDFAVIGEGEETFPELCMALMNNKPLTNIHGIGYKDKDKIIFTKPRELITDLNSLPFPARHLLPSKWYFAPPRIRGVWTKSTATIMASRGCPYRCIYCSSHLMFGRRVRFRTPENIIKELKHLREKYKIDSVWFADDTFTLNPEWVTKFCNLLKQQKWKNFKWAAQARVNTVSYNLLKLMKSAGCVQLDFGVESGSPRILKILKKDITPEKVIEAFRISKKAKLLRFASFMIGIPGETEKDLEQTEKLALRIKPDYTDFLYTVPYPGTELFDLAKKHGVLDNVADYSKWILGKQTDKPVMYTTIPKEKLIKWRSRLHNHFFFRNYKTFLGNPKFLFGGIKIFLTGINGLIPGIKRFINTGKIDSIFIQILKEYRRKMKRLSQI